MQTSRRGSTYDGGCGQGGHAGEEERIKAERLQAHSWCEAAQHQVEDVMKALKEALALVDASVP
jgi:hypothetical protein